MTKKDVLSPFFFFLLLTAGVVCGLTGAEPKVYDYGNEPMRFLENSRIRLGIDLSLGGAVTWLSDTNNGGENMINGVDWGRQIQLSYYSGPIPYIGPNGEEPADAWRNLGWNPIQSGDYGGYRSKVLSFKQLGKNKMAVRCIPMQWPHTNVPAETVFECVYTLTSNGFILDAKIINNRSDQNQYPAMRQEMPAVYTNGKWYKLVSYLGSEPFQKKPVTTLIAKNDERGWPWINYYSPERWSALIDDNGTGLGVYQPESTRITAGFFGGDDHKGVGGPKDAQTGYIAPLAMMIIDHNIERSYRTFFILGTVDEIRSRVYKLAKKDLDKIPDTKFDGDRRCWIYEGPVHDSGYPIKDHLEISFDGGGKMVGPETFWKAEDAPLLEIDGAFRAEGVETAELKVHLSPFSPADTVDTMKWPLTPKQEQEKAEKEKTYPVLPEITLPLQISCNGERSQLQFDLRDLDRYTGPMKRVSIEFPNIKGEADIYEIRFMKSE